MLEGQSGTKIAIEFFFVDWHPADPFLLVQIQIFVSGRQGCKVVQPYFRAKCRGLTATPSLTLYVQALYQPAVF
jgi:hypothetical protein